MSEDIPAAVRRVSHGMILAAGKGTRMRAAADDPPKPLTEIGGISLLARMMARFEAAGIRRIIVNMHHKAAFIEAAIAAHQGPADVVLSDERAALLETGGGVKKALPLLGAAPFLVANGDVLWCEARPAVAALCAAFDPARMDALLLLADTQTASGYDGSGDYDLAADGRLSRKTDDAAPYVFAGVQILSPAIFAAMPDGAFSLNLVYDAAQADGRLFGQVLDGQWMHVGTPEGRAAAEAKLSE